MIRLLALVLLATPAAAQDVLFVGNSYVASNQLHARVQLLLRQGVPAWSASRTEATAPGGYRFVQHLADADGSNGATPLRGWLTDDDPWSWVVFQEQSQVGGFPQSSPYWTESRDSFVALDDLTADTERPADSVLLMTWGRRDGDAQNPDRYGDFPAMQAALSAGYRGYRDAASSDERPVWIAPAGMAWQQVWDEAQAAGEDPFVGRFADLYVGDGSHPSLAGSYLAACVIYATISGRDPAGLAVAEGLDAALGVDLQRIAGDVVLRSSDGDLSWPFDFELAEWASPDDVEPGSFAISSPGMRPRVELGSAAPTFVRLVIGADHGGLAGSGELRVVEGGVLEAQDVLLAEGPLSEAALLLLGGDATLGAVELGRGEGRVLLAGAAVELASSTAPLELSGGSLTLVGAPRVLGDLVQSGGTLHLDDGATVQAGAVSLDGAVAVTITDLSDPDRTEAVLLQAEALSGAPSFAAPAGVEVAVEGDALIARWVARDEQGVQDPADIDPLGEIAASCGCSGGGAGGALLLPLLIGLRRRR